jgi:hypothetical protein
MPTGVLIALAWAASACEEPAPGKKQDQEAWLALLLPPLVAIVAGGLQIAVMAAFPRFARRCAAAVSRYRWQTPLAGLAGFMGTILLASVANAVAGGNQKAGVPVIVAAVLIAAVGGVGVSLVAGRWAAKRIDPDRAAHPLLEIVAGSALLGWAGLLVPCAGQLLVALASWASLGAFILAVLLGRRLDEARSWSDAVPAASQPVPAAPPEPPAPVPPPEPESVPESRLF